MGVNPLPTGGIYKYFTFDGETSASFGVHITGEGVFNAPKRAVEMVNIPARNGAFALDQGYFENIEVTYNASIVADTDADFADAISALRNFLCSRTGYCRLEDDYNPNEYRMAVYKSGLEVTPFVLKTGEFNITFDCKPQRFLKSGDVNYIVSSGGTLTNITRFPSKPLLLVHGYGNIDINGADIDIENVIVGNFSDMVNPQRKQVATLDAAAARFTATFRNDMFAAGNEVTLTGKIVIVEFSVFQNVEFANTTTVTDITNCSCQLIKGTRKVALKFTLPQFNFVIGISSEATTSSAVLNWHFKTGESGTTTISIGTLYNQNSNQLTYLLNRNTKPRYCNELATTTTGVVSGYSTLTIPDTIYFDLDIGEVWSTINGELTVLNNVAQLPAELPQLEVGDNIITYDDTITDLKIQPRWWQV